VRFLLVIEITEIFIFSLKNQPHLPFTEFVKWILSFCSNIETLTIPLIGQPNDLHKDIVRLKKLKDLHIGTSVGIDAEEVT
jgi:hypothetical protein